jgi:ubiquitin-like domain-containing CTD phosphatase 1
MPLLNTAAAGLTSNLALQEDATVGAVRQVLADLTEVQPKRQKLIGLGKKPNPEDDLSLASLNLKKDHSFMMVGCKESSVLSEPPAAELPAVVNDLDWDYQLEEYKNVKISPEYRANVEEKVST